MEKKVRKPKEYKKGSFQYASCSTSFTHEEGKEPASLYINCDVLTLKDAKKLKVWIDKAIKWLSVQK